MPDMFVWYELITTDLDAAAAYYQAVVGWTAKDSGQPGKRYLILHAGDRMVAGLMETPEGCDAPPCWTGYVGVAAVEPATEAVRAAGGTVHRAPEDIPGVGRFSVVADPLGAIFELFTPSDPASAPAPVPPGTPGHVGWHELRTSDPAAALDFYGSRFGWTKAEAVDMGPTGTYQLFAVGGEAIGGMTSTTKPAERPAWLFYVNVPGIDAAAVAVTERGGRVVNGPMQVPGGNWIVHCIDPQGAAYALVAPAR